MVSVLNNKIIRLPNCIPVEQTIYEKSISKNCKT